jgi:hypothetical protein
METDMSKKIALELTSAVVIGGKVKTRGTPVNVDTKLAKNLLQRGKATLADAPVPSPEPDDNTAVPLDKHSVADLKVIAAEYEIEGADKMNKAQLIEAIEAVENGDD